MCGISGIYSLKREGSWGGQVRAMNQKIAHRGPDDEGVYEAPGLALGHRRLSIIDLSSAGHQPMSYDNGRYVIVYNGELYNFRELKSELAGMPFSTSTDTEVILAAYVRWGTSCVDHFNGMFAFALWDTQKEELFIARDRLGIKPLYYWFQNDTLVFASEVRALLASGLVPAQLNTAALGDYLRYQTVHAPATLLRDVHMLLPGHFIAANAQGLTEKEWWSPVTAATVANTTDDYAAACKNVRGLLRAAVERRLVADVPFGAFLSGGIDSSAIVGLMSEVATSKVKTFSVTFDESEFSEARYAQQVAEKFHTEHHELKLTPDDFLRDLPGALAAMDHPSGDGPNTFIVSKATKQAGITMALSGLGGDELFAGYAIFKRAFELREKAWMNKVPRPLRELTGMAMKTLKPGVASAKKAEVLGLDTISFEAAYPFNRQVLSEAQVEALAGKTTYAHKAFELNGSIPENHLLSKVSLLEIRTYMQNVLLRDTDQMSMAHALEVRVPFLDYQLVEYVLSLPDELKFPHTPKKLLTDALGDLIPHDIIHRPKMGFTLPWKHWMKKELHSFCEARLDVMGQSGVLNHVAVQQLWKNFLHDDPYVSWSRVWPLVVLGDWMQRNSITA